MIYKMELSDSVDTMIIPLLEVPIIDNDITGLADNTTIDGNVFRDYLWLKKQYVQKWSIMCQAEYEQLRGFWTRQFGNAEVPFYRLFYGDNVYEDKTGATTDGYLQINNDAPLESPLTLTKLTGNATQKTLSGKNKANISVIPDQTAASLKITVANDTITIKDNSNAVGYTNTQKKLSEICPSLQVGDTVYLFFDTTSTTAPNKNRVYLGGAYWDKSTSQTITQTMLDAQLVFYGGHDETAVISNFMITKTNDATYEPYVGGIPSPNPDFPQAINTVSGEQTVKITGKNMFADTSDGFTKPTDYYVRPIQLVQGKTYQFYQQLKPGKTALSNIVVGIVPYGDKYADFSSVMRNIINYNATTADRVFIPDSTWTSPKIVIYASGVAQIDDIMDTYDIMLEESATKTQFEPYQGQEYTIDLGATELAKIGTYQDYIWNDDGTWKIHKEIGKIDLSTISWYGSSLRTTTSINNIKYVPNNQTLGSGIAEKYIMHIGSGMSGASALNCIAIDVSQVSVNTGSNTINPTGLFYYALATPTDTEITDSGLIAQLNHIYELYQGTNNLWLIPSAGAQGEMEVQYRLNYEQETDIVPKTPVVLTLTDGGVINPCGCRENIQLTMRETTQGNSES